MPSSTKMSLVSIREVMPCRIPLPFMPDRIDYKIGKGCCEEILLSNGLFVPCSRHCEEGTKCTKHLKKSSKYGTYEERYNAWEKRESYFVMNDKKVVRENPYWMYLNTKGLDSIALEKEFLHWGIPLQFNSEWNIPVKKRPAPSKLKKRPFGTSLDAKREDLS
jgi:hypothetical protein